MRNLVISPLFSDGMVLQHGMSVPVSGESFPMAQITLSFPRETYKTRADKGGKWLVILDSHSPGGPYSMEILTENDTILIKDIYFGDVWLCSGQSNMELPMRRVKDDFPHEWNEPNPLIRQFCAPQEWDFSGPRQKLSGGRWIAAGADTLAEFSATAWFFAGQIFKTYNHPIGIILAAWGGTPIEAFMSADALAAFPEKIALGKKYADTCFCDSLIREKTALIETWNNELGAADSGLTQGWQKPETDISAWDEMPLPGDFKKAGQNDHRGFCGVIWLCREFEVSEALAAANEAKVWLGTIVDADTVYINGVEVGNTGYRYPPRKYAIPPGVLHTGKNRIVIRVVCCNGEGGITQSKPFRIFSNGGASDSIANNAIGLSGIWKYRVGKSVGPRPQEFFLHRQPMGIFNAMIAPLLGYPCRAVLWYQGESNDSSPDEYASLFKSMINDWRAKIPTPGPRTPIPFLFVQLPIFGDPEDNNESDSWAIIREAQASALSLPMTGMAAALEFGEWNDLHPVNKKGVGLRLALAAEKVVFNKENTSPGPLLRSVRHEKGRLLLTFDNCGKGLRADETPYISVIAGGNNYRVPAAIEGPDCLSADISDIENPEKVLYAWAHNPRDRHLYNSDGLPVIPFRAEIN